MTNIQYWAIASMVVFFVGPFAGMIGAYGSGIDPKKGIKMGIVLGLIAAIFCFLFFMAALPVAGIDPNGKMISP